MKHARSTDLLVDYMTLAINSFNEMERQNMGRWLHEANGKKVLFEFDDGRRFRLEETGIRRIA